MGASTYGVSRIRWCLVASAVLLFTLLLTAAGATSVGANSTSPGEAHAPTVFTYHFTFTEVTH
jgi:hypothetical protein